ncbi:MAG: helix-turn-helix domain-containing protein [Candidatus Atabeyarchaeum deiterrae]|jgi:sugar-specific transcriptional regulator TrmB
MGIEFSFDSRVYGALHELGLTEYESRIYIALVSKGTTTAIELSQLTEVPYSRIYDVLGRLERKGWIESQKSKPTKYAPKPPLGAVRAAKLEIQGRIEELEKEVIADLQPVYERGGKSERPEVYILYGEDNVLKKIEESIQKAEKYILLALPNFGNREFSVFFPVLGRLRSSNVKVRLLTSKIDSRTISRLSELAETRVRESLYGGGAIIDGREAMIILTEQTTKGDNVINIGIWAKHIGLAVIANNYFEYLWKT